MNFLDSYLEMVDDSEPPLIYHKWAAVSALSIAAARRVWVRRGHERIFPNIYVVLVGPSGVRKSVALGLGRSLLRSLGHRITLIPESITRRAFLEALSHATDQFDENGNPEKDQGRAYRHSIPGEPSAHYSAGIIASELSTLLRRDNTDLFSDLTDLYDASDEPWEYRTAHVGANKLHGACITLFGASAPDWVTLMLPWETVGGGFTARVLFITANKKRKTVLRPRWGEKEKGLRKGLVGHLKAITELEGAMQVSEAAWAAYDEFYLRQEKQMEDGKPPLSDPRLSRYIERRPTHLLKLATLVSLSRSPDLQLSAADMHGAVFLLREAEKAGMGSIFEGKGANPLAGVARKVLVWVGEQGGEASEIEILRAFGDDIDSGQLFRIQQQLKKQAAIDLIDTAQGKSWKLL